MERVEIEMSSNPGDSVAIRKVCTWLTGLSLGCYTYVLFFTEEPFCKNMRLKKSQIPEHAKNITRLRIRRETSILKIVFAEDNLL